MTDLAKYVTPLVLENLKADEEDYLTEVFTRFNGYPALEEVWQLMDEQWIAHGCDPERIDERVTAFYKHPVWMLNGLFIEQHAQSLDNRRLFTDWVVSKAPERLVDFGGGFGGLARFIGKALPNAQVEVLEPHPHPAAIALATSTPNVRFVSELSGEYDLLIATDVFEHVPDPIGLAADTAEHLRVGGQYLIANCFQPVILCHLPQLFYFNVAWDPTMLAMGLQPCERVQYGRVYRREGAFNVTAARKVAECGRGVHRWISWLPWGSNRVGHVLMRLCGQRNA